ncbi:hypothetical protein EYZ11_012514 [Aspergillus tanneri]|uniref:Arabinan endo-1,5-alpha-L-arabinosidase n=1 Tax=Aspergillus tanneri TaxID=1220188 RepID=A0A4S3J026_9EURO|nr:uncharacterized protein ATNIH1004_008095 [Aspergillus tanneri]KAA8643899.1 hypothetical protein ATNIH1004_008095 [Aspergillus tanneri]THC88043.1 hypothetical protein EYZ11_012514 [Aspergillus tanneri]
MNVLTLLFFLSVAYAYANPGPCSGNCWTHDPGFFQRVSDGKYFRFATGNGIHVASADSIEGPWKEDGYVFPHGSSIDHPGNDDLWAPDVHYESGQYFMYYSVSTLGSQDSIIGVATSPSMEVGTWTDHGWIGLSSTSQKPYNTIDANWVRIGGKPYLNWGSYWHGLYQVPMATPLDLSHQTPTNIAYNATGNHDIEASFMFEHDGWYYLTFSSGKTGDYDQQELAPGDEYRIVVCRSKSGTGGFVDQKGRSCLESGGTTLLASHGKVYGPGGQGIANDKKLGLVLYYHYTDTSIGLSTDQYQFGWNQLRWKDGWPVV